MKKTIILLLAVALTLFVFAAIIPDSQSKQKKDPPKRYEQINKKQAMYNGILDGFDGEVLNAWVDTHTGNIYVEIAGGYDD